MAPPVEIVRQFTNGGEVGVQQTNNKKFSVYYRHKPGGMWGLHKADLPTRAAADAEVAEMTEPGPQGG